MAILEFEVSDDLAQRIRGFFNSGHEGALIVHFAARRVVKVHPVDTWPNDPVVALVRQFIPMASGIYIADLTRNAAMR